MSGTQYVAFLRAINVGGRTVRMDRLREAFQALDLANVATFIASGNVIFDSGARNARKLEARIETHLHRVLGFEVDTHLRSVPELAGIAAYEPFPHLLPRTVGALLLVGFMRDPATAELATAAASLCSDVDALHVAGREVYWLRTRPSESRIAAGMLDKAVRAPMTTRNINTIHRILAKFGPAG
jgi:uncharacterized protein (DUF1697 family)